MFEAPGSPGCGLPDVSKPFLLFVGKSKGLAKGVFTQTMRTWRQPVAYMSKKPDPVAAGWLPCLPVVAAVTLLVKDADKLIDAGPKFDYCNPPPMHWKEC